VSLELSPSERRRLTAVLRHAAAYRRDFAPELRPTGLSPAAAESLLALAADSPVTVGQVAERLGRDQPATSRALAELRRAGLAKQLAAPGRRAPHELTRAGQRAANDYLSRLE